MALTKEQKIDMLETAIEGLYEVLIRLASQPTVTTTVDGVSTTYRSPTQVNKSIAALELNLASLSPRQRIVVGSRGNNNSNRYRV